MSVSPAEPKRPPAQREPTVAVEWPSICAGPWGRWLGRLYGLRAGVRVGSVPITVGWALVVLTAPLAGLLYLAGKAPRRPFLLFGPLNPDGVRYRLTTARVLIEHPFEKALAPLAELGLPEFDRIEIDVLPGQGWFDAGDVVLLDDSGERLRLRGVARPEPFVRTLMKTQQAATIRGGKTQAPTAAAV